MSVFKPGDKVEIVVPEGTVRVDQPNGDFGKHIGVTADWIAGVAFVRADCLRKVSPPVKVGDTVTPDNIGQLGEGSRLEDGLDRVWQRVTGLWRCVGRDAALDDEVLLWRGMRTFVVLRVGTGEAP
jgi:hypothetical protein